jgi:superfamily II DNA or RNA helicase
MNKITILDHKVAKVELDDPIMFDRLTHFLSFRFTGVEYSSAFKSGNWDGITYMINAKKQFPIGLLSKVKDWLAQNNIQYHLIDDSKEIELYKPLDISKGLAAVGWTPRDYQLKVVELCNQNNLGIIRAATGSGKTLIGALMTANFNKPTMVYVIGLDLLNQFHETFSALFEEKIGYIGNGVCDIQRINIASIWTIGRALDIKLSDLVVDDEIDEEAFKESDKYKVITALKEAKLHILDECHIATTSTLRSIHKAINPEHMFGLSGTPFREDNTDLLIEGLLGPKMIDIAASELIKKKVLVQPYIKFIESPHMKCTGKYPTIYKDFIVEHKARNELIAQETKKLIDKNYKPLVLFKTIRHGDLIAKELQALNIRFALLSGKDSLDKRIEVKNKLNNNEIDCILASTILDIGFDLPKMSGLILSGSGKSYVRALQRIGRVLRTYPDKKAAAIVDFYDNVKFLKKHSKARFDIYSSEPGFIILNNPF